MLRPRYKPDWTPSWEGTKKPYFTAEDSSPILFPGIMDATRISDDKLVTVKKISKSTHPFEADIAQLLSSPPLSTDPHNHCVPIYDVLQCPDEDDTQLLAMPILRQYDDPRMDSIGEAVDFFHQIFEGLQFMHSHHVAHRDCMALNIMLEPSKMYPRMYHPLATLRNRDFKGTAKYYSRTERPSKYYFIDFGLARKYNPEDGPPREVPIHGGDRTVPEFEGSDGNEPKDPFPTDVYYLGNLIRQNFLQKYRGFDFMETLVTDMTHEDPAKRPTIDVVVERFVEIRRGLSSWKLRARLAKKHDSAARWMFFEFIHIFRTASYVVRRLPAVPDYTATH